MLLIWSFGLIYKILPNSGLFTRVWCSSSIVMILNVCYDALSRYKKISIIRLKKIPIQAPYAHHHTRPTRTYDDKNQRIYVQGNISHLINNNFMLQ